MTVPTPSRFDDLARSIDAAAKVGRRRQLVVRRVEGTSLVAADGSRLLNFGGNDYLGIVARSGVHHAGGHSGATASALVCGWSPQHHKLAMTIAELERTESAVVFPSGYAACSGAIACLASRGDLILSDSLNHASLIDGCRLSGAEKIIFPHADVGFIEQTLQQSRSRFANVWIVTDSVFSMDGDVAPLVELVNVADRWNAHLIVDEAHGTGVLGDRGAGLVEMLGLADQIPVRIGTLSKAIGHHGGFVAGPSVVIDYLVQFCRSLIFSTAIPPLTASGAAAVIAQLPTMRDQRLHLRTLGETLRARLAGHLRVGGRDDPTPIIPIIIGGEAETVRLSERLQEAGFYVPAIRPPTVAPGQSRLRISLSAAHTTDDVERLAGVIESLA